MKTGMILVSPPISKYILAGIFKSDTTYLSTTFTMPQHNAARRDRIIQFIMFLYGKFLISGVSFLLISA